MLVVWDTPALAIPHCSAFPPPFPWALLWGWDFPQLFSLTFVDTGTTGAVWWAGEGQELWFYPSEAGGGSGNPSSRSPSMWDKFQAPSILQMSRKCWPGQGKELLKEGAGEGGQTPSALIPSHTIP